MRRTMQRLVHKKLWPACWQAKKLERREPKVAYNGALGVPIREEVLSRHNNAVITRNSMVRASKHIECFVC